MEFDFQHAGTVHRIHLKAERGTYRIDLGKGPVDIDIRPISDHCLSLIMKQKSFLVYYAQNERRTYIHVNGHEICLEKADRTVGVDAGRAGAEGGSIAAPMPGTVVAIQVQQGDRVKKNQSLVIVESMKMENALRSPMEGRVERVHFQEGDLVDAGVPIVEIVPVEESG